MISPTERISVTLLARKIVKSERVKSQLQDMMRAVRVGGKGRELERVSGRAAYEQACPCTGSCRFSYCITKASAFDYVSCPMHTLYEFLWHLKKSELILLIV